jgi:diguanylate cyclase (GGDEF)-like protein
MTRKLRAAALTDVLTELPNRRYAMLRLTQEWEASTQSKRPLSIVLCDLDHFKAVNDERGHEVGDVVLRSTAATLRAHTRRGDVVCRLGGEEFLIINVNSDARGAAMCAERLRTAVQKNRVRVGSQDVSVTASLGWAERGPATPDVDALLRAADEAVYSAKAGGRNIVRGPLRRSA